MGTLVGARGGARETRPLVIHVLEAASRALCDQGHDGKGGYSRTPANSH